MWYKNIFKMYPSDIKDKEWKIVWQYFEPKKTGRPRKHGIRVIINVIRYVMRTGCQWRQLPKDKQYSGR